jgi:hypothetical protein
LVESTKTEAAFMCEMLKAKKHSLPARALMRNVIGFDDFKAGGN